MSPRTVDVIVIGGGPAGENVAQYAHEGGLSVVVVEGELLGGECSYYACMPSKALLRPLDVQAASAHLPGLIPARVDREALLARRDEWVSHYDDSSQMSWARDADIDVVRGHGRLVAPKTVDVDGQRIEAKRAVVLATGSTPTIPKLFADIAAWGSRDATALQEIPQKLIIVGGGVIACEAATWMSALGSSVTMLVRGSSLLTGQEPFAGEIVGDALRDLGVEIVFEADITAITRENVRESGLGRIHGGAVSVIASHQPYTADEILLATGRHPRLDDVGLESVGLDAEDVRKGRLPDWLYAIGDAGYGPALTHMGKYEARVLGAKLAGQQDAPAPEFVPVPQVVFTDPQVASSGLTEVAARGKGMDVVTAQVPFASAAGTSLLRDDGVGFAKIVVNNATGSVVGATFVGHETAELVHSATVAIVGQVPVKVLRHAVPAYPTASELWLRMLEQLPIELR